MRPDRQSRPGGESQAAQGVTDGDLHSIDEATDRRRRPRRRLTVTFTGNKHCAYVSGHGSRELLTELRGRPPLWSSLSRAWATTARTARDLVAVAESRGYEVIVEHDLTGATSVAPDPAPESTIPATSIEDPLW